MSHAWNPKVQTGQIEPDEAGPKPDEGIVVDILLIVGATMALFGAFQGAISYRAYTAGTAEHIANTKAGTIVVPEEAPGNPGRKAGAIVGFTTAGIRILMVIYRWEAVGITRHADAVQVTSERKDRPVLS